MRQLLLVVGVSALAALSAAACSSSDNAGPGTTEDTPDGSTSGGDTGSTTGPSRDSFTLAPIADTTLIAGRTSTAAVSVVRGAHLSDPINVTVSGLPTGVTAGPLSLAGSDGVLTLTAAADAKVGELTAIVTASVTPSGGSQITLTTSLKVTVRAVPGSVDTSWGDQGSVSGLLGDFGLSYIDLLLAPDDSIYALGLCQGNSADVACSAHIKADGTIDAAYGASGLAIMQGISTPKGAALQADSAITLVGGNGQGKFTEYAVRLDKDGVVDQSGKFGDGVVGPGSTFTDPPDPFVNNGSLLVLQRKKDSDLFIAFDNGTTQPGVMDLHLDASLNTAYGTGGAAKNGNGQILAMAIRDDAAPKDGTLAVVWLDGTSIRYQEQNALNGALVGTAQSITATGVNRYFALPGHAQLADGSLVVPVNQADGLGFYLVKFSPTGAATSFGTGGLAGPFAVHGHATGIALQADGKLVVAVNASSGAPVGQDNEVLMRFDATGTLDTDFGTAGFVTHKTGTKSQSQKVVVQKSGRIIATVAEYAPLDAVLTAYNP